MKRALSMVFVLMMFLVLQPFTASAASPSLPASGGNLGDTTYQLTEDTVITNTLVAGSGEGADPKIDLNGHTLTITKIVITSTGSLTVYDSSENKSGKIQGGEISIGDNNTLCGNSGTITSDVYISGGCDIYVDQGNPGATFTGTINNHGTIYAGNFTGTVTNDSVIFGGTFSGTVKNGSTIKGGEFTGTVLNGYYEKYASVTAFQAGCIEGGKFYGTVENTEFMQNTLKNYISGGWFFPSAPTGNVEYKTRNDNAGVPTYKVFYKSNTGSDYALNVLQPPVNTSGDVTPDLTYVPSGLTTSTFDGWYTDAACTQKAVDGTPLTEDITLYGIAKEAPAEPVIVPWDNPFGDANPEDWFYESVRFVQEQGWMNGKSADSFDPYGKFTRAEISAVLYNRAGNPEVNTDRVLYADDQTDAWYTKAVYWMTDEGNASGIGGYFYPNEAVTREELATMLYNAAGRPETNGTLFQFLDAGDASDWAVTPLCWAAEQGIMIGNGDGTLTPGAYCTRAEAAAILRNFGRAVLNS